MTDLSTEDELALDRVLESEPEDVRENVRQIARQIRSEGSGQKVIEGMEAVRNTMLAAGAPVPRVLFGEIARAMRGTSARRSAVARKLAGCVPNRGTGCIKIDFYDQLLSKPRVLFLVLDECGEDHDLGAELDKIKSRTTEKNYDELVKKHLSHLVHCGRGAYNVALEKAEPILKSIRKKMPEGVDPFSMPSIEHANTTIHMRIPGSKRVGIFVRFKDEVIDSEEAGAE